MARQGQPPNGCHYSQSDRGPRGAGRVRKISGTETSGNPDRRLRGPFSHVFPWLPRQRGRPEEFGPSFQSPPLLKSGSVRTASCPSRSAGSARCKTVDPGSPRKGSAYYKWGTAWPVFIVTGTAG